MLNTVDVPRPVSPHSVEFIPPRVSVGQVVLWSYGQSGDKPSPALVLTVGTRTLNLAVHVEGVRDHVHKTGVRHRDDPTLLRMPEHDAGVWALTARDQLLDRLLAAGPYVEEE